MKVTVISDTHNRHLHLDIPDSDCIIHCGDFSNTAQQIIPFVKWFGSLPHRYKILIAGNHDYILESLIESESYKKLFAELGIIYLCNSGIELEGIKFWGSPFSNEFGRWAFMRNDLDLQLEAWDYIPEDTQVLLTHGPAKGLGDQVYQIYGDEESNHVGSQTLRETIERLPKLTHHFYGHIHESAGLHMHPHNKYVSYNAASWDYMDPEMKTPYVFSIKARN